MAKASAGDLEGLLARLEALEAEADIRRLQARYYLLCDTPCPEPGVETLSDRLDRIMALYADDAVWEGVGAAYTGLFGRMEGQAAIRAHFQRFWTEKQDPALVLNTHYLASEQIRVRGEVAEGQWVQVQPWVFGDGRAVLRSSRLSNGFRRVEGVWKIQRTRSESLFTAPLPVGWAETVQRVSVLMRDQEKGSS